MAQNSTVVEPQFVKIDNALEEYYSCLGIPNYRNCHGNGIFLQAIIDDELDDIEIPIDQELGYGSQSNDCVYTWLWGNTTDPFPIPLYAQIPHNKTELFTFYILQYCYRHGSAPSHQHIQNVIIPKCNGTVDMYAYQSYVETFHCSNPLNFV